MVWVRLEAEVDEHPKLAALDDHAFAMYVCGLTYCNRNLTDGFIPTAIGLKLRHATRPKANIAQLVAGRLWEPVDGGWRVHDYLKYQPSREQVEAEREHRRAARAAAGRAGGQAKASKRCSKPVANGVAKSWQTSDNPVANVWQNPGPGTGDSLRSSVTSVTFPAPGRQTGDRAGTPADGRAREKALPPEVAERLGRPPIPESPRSVPRRETNGRTNGRVS